MQHQSIIYKATLNVRLLLSTDRESATVKHSYQRDSSYLPRVSLGFILNFLSCYITWQLLSFVLNVSRKYMRTSRSFSGIYPYMQPTFHFAETHACVEYDSQFTRDGEKPVASQRSRGILRYRSIHSGTNGRANNASRYTI